MNSTGCTSRISIAKSRDFRARQYYFGGQGKEEKQMRLAVSELIFAVKSKEAADQLPLQQLERELRILHAYEKVPQRNLGNNDSVLQQITEVIREYDERQSEEWDMPF
jgi:hypothetical protein